jgi:hypothetical protein
MINFYPPWPTHAEPAELALLESGDSLCVSG